MEAFQNGMPLVLILDHINGNNRDDRLENLRWVCPNCNMQLPTTNGRNKRRIVYNRPIRDQHKYCVDCGKEISTRSIRCRDCDYKNRVNNNEMRISRDDLKNKIRNLTFIKIGEEFGVSDKAITKWCIKYNLPSKKKDIKSYSDAEQELI